MNEKVRFLLYLIAAVLLGAFLAHAGALLLLAIPVLVYLIAGLIQSPPMINLSAQRSLSRTSVIAGEPVEISLHLKNEGSSQSNLWVEDQPGGIDTKAEGAVRHKISLPAGEKTTLHYHIAPDRGLYSWEFVRLRAADPFDLFSVETRIPAQDQLVVRPRPVEVRGIMLKPEATMVAAGAIPANRGGPGTDYLGVRPYRTGDPLRRVNWRLLARYRDLLFTNEFEREAIADFGLIVDARVLSAARARNEALFEHSVRAASSFAEEYSKLGNRVSLLIFGQRMKTVFPGAGKNHRNQILSKLAGAQLDGYVPFEYIEYFPSRLFSTRSQIIIFSPFDDRDLPGYASLRAFGYDVVLISPNPVDYAASQQPPSAAHDLAYRAARIERVVQLQQLIRMGVKVVDWPLDRPLQGVAIEAMRSYRRRNPSLGRYQ